MTDDIVQRLRRQAARAAERPTLYDEAAYEIERLRAENAELRERQRQVMRVFTGAYQQESPC